MREIKFRAKSVYTGEWEYGNYIHSKRFEGCSNEYRIHNKMIGCESDVIPETVGQFTGLTDKKGVEIYEGDILIDYEIELESQQDISGKLEVVYDFSKGQFAVDNSFQKDGSNLVNLVEYFGIENLEVVGNIHDNPEQLLK